MEPLLQVLTLVGLLGTAALLGFSFGGVRHRLDSDFRLRRLRNPANRKLDEDRREHGLPPVMENPDYLWVRTVIDGERVDLALTDTEMKRVAKRTKANADVLVDPDELPLRFTW